MESRSPDACLQKGEIWMQLTTGGGWLVRELESPSISTEVWRVVFIPAGEERHTCSFEDCWADTSLRWAISYEVEDVNFYVPIGKRQLFVLCNSCVTDRFSTWEFHEEAGA